MNSGVHCGTMKHVTVKYGLENFTLARYRITLVPESTIAMPALNKGNVLRGAFGSSLRRLVCSMDRRSRLYHV